MLESMLRQIVSGLLYLHENRVIHQDMKPHNILLTQDGVCKLADFGCARLIDPSKTSTKTTGGTIVYMAPEVMAGKALLASDMWSLGMTIMHMATGEEPWSHLADRDWNQTELLFHIAQDSTCHPPPAGVPTLLQDTLGSLLQRIPEDRPTALDLQNSDYLCPASPTYPCSPGPLASGPSSPRLYH
eukprot:gene12929-biopygen5593